jgi:hypothetical protein
MKILPTIEALAQLTPDWKSNILSVITRKHR